MQPLTHRQAEVLDMIRTHIDTTGVPPSRGDIARAFGFRSPRAVADHLRALERKGAIALIPGTARGIRVLGEATEPHGVPLVGRVAAGDPILAEQHIEGHFRLDASLFRRRVDYLLLVRGMSMKDAGILDGDLLAVHRTPEATDGQVVVARVGDEVTVKRFRRQGQRVRLLPENPAFDPIEIDLRREPLSIEGIGVGVIRRGDAL